MFVSHKRYWRLLDLLAVKNEEMLRARERLSLLEARLEALEGNQPAAVSAFSGVSAGQGPDHTLSRPGDDKAACSCGWASDDYGRYGATVQFGNHVFDVTPVEERRG